MSACGYSRFGVGISHSLSSILNSVYQYTNETEKPRKLSVVYFASKRDQSE
jgi:hypothetical protein